MNGFVAAIATATFATVASSPLPPPHPLPDGSGTLQLLTSGDPMALPGQADGVSSGVGRQLAGDGRLAAFRTQAGNLAGFELSVLVGGVVATAADGVIGRINALAEAQVPVSEMRTPVVSRDGSTIAFALYAESAPIGLVRLYSDIYLMDVASGARQRVTRDAQDPALMGWSLNPSISADGGLVAFESLEPLVPGDTGLQDVYLWQRAGAGFTRISRAADGSEANGASRAPSMSDDGNRIAFVSSATNLEPDSSFDQSAQIFLHDRTTGVTRLVSRTPSGAAANAASSGPAISPDGRFVAFLSNANNLVPGDDNGYTDAFVFDSESGAVSRVSITNGGAQANAPIEVVSTCDAGRRVVFASAATNLDSLGSEPVRKVFLHERLTAQVRVLGVPAAGGPVSGYFGFPTIAPDCSSVVYPSSATGLGPADGNGLQDVFREDLDVGGVVAMSRWSGPQPSTALLGEAKATRSSISADGQRIIVDYIASNMVPGDDSSKWRSVLIDRAAGSRTRIDGPVISGSELPRFTSALAAAAPVSSYLTLVPNGVSSLLPVYVRMLGTRTDIVVTPPGVPGPDFIGAGPMVSADGTRVLFGSSEGATAEGDSPIYFATVGTGIVEPISAPPFGGMGALASLAPGGDFAAYVTSKAIAPEDDDFSGIDVYLVDLRTRAHRLLTPELPAFNALVLGTAISGDGQKVAFITNSPFSESQLPECPGRVRLQRVLVHDVASGQTSCGSLNAVDPAQPDTGFAAIAVSMSPNGRWLAYLTYSLLYGENRIFVTDLETGVTTVANRSVVPREIRSLAEGPAVSDQGHVVFSTEAPLVPEDVSRRTRDVYLFKPAGYGLFDDGFEAE